MLRNVFLGCCTHRDPGEVSNISSTYEKLRKSDLDVQRFEESVRERTNYILSGFRNQSEGSQTVSVEAMRRATTGLLATQDGVLNIILEHKKDVWNDSELFGLVRAFFTTSAATLDFCNATERSVHVARQNHLLVLNVVARWGGGRNLNKNKVKEICQEMRNYLNAEIPFSKAFMTSLMAVQKQHEILLSKLLEKGDKLGKKAKRAKILGKVSSVMLVATISAIVISAVVAAAIAAPPVAAALAAAASFPATAIGSWVEQLLASYEKEIKAREEVCRDMGENTYGAIQELTNIRSWAQTVETTMSSWLNTMEFGLQRGDPDALQIAVNNLEHTSSTFMNNLEALEERVRGARASIVAARDQVLAKISRQWGRKFSLRRPR